MVVNSIVKIQANIRGYLARRRYRGYRSRIVKIQSLIRSYKVRKDYEIKRNAIIKMQSIYKMRKQRRVYLKVWLRDQSMAIVLTFDPFSAEGTEVASTRS